MLRLADEAGVGREPRSHLGTGQVDLASAQALTLGLAEVSEPAVGHALLHLREPLVEVEKQVVVVALAGYVEPA